MELKVGDEVVCTDATPSLKSGHYTVSWLLEEYIRVNGVQGGWYAHRFDLVKPAAARSTDPATSNE